MKSQTESSYNLKSVSLIPGRVGVRHNGNLKLVHSLFTKPDVGNIYTNIQPIVRGIVGFLTFNGHFCQTYIKIYSERAHNRYIRVIRLGGHFYWEGVNFWAVKEHYIIRNNIS